MANLKVAVRVRPMSDREVEIGAIPSLLIEDGTLSVTNIKVPEHNAGDSRERIRKFYFDYCFDETATQDEVFSMIENEISTALTNRYHACVLAYGQSSTGKTFTMMGSQDDPGLTPRLCENIFRYFHSSISDEEIKNIHIYVSYLEIYNERVIDLLVSNNTSRNLKVREHPKKGPYVQGLSEHRVDTCQELLSWLSVGNSSRRVAATNNNRHSSRSHCVFTIYARNSRGKACKLHLVDLAGSERNNTTSGCNAPRLKEGANINRSLVALGNVICALSDQPGKNKKQSRKRFVPYRDSVLTWLLKETLGGNSKTVMIATISPSSTCYNETVNTLRFGQRAQQVVNQPLVNEDSQEKLIRELREEVAKLKELLNAQNLHAIGSFRSEDIEKMAEVTQSLNPGQSGSGSISGEIQKYTLLPVQVIASDLPTKIIEFIPAAVDSENFTQQPPDNPKKERVGEDCYESVLEGENTKNLLEDKDTSINTPRIEIDQPTSTKNKSICFTPKGLVNQLLSSILHFDSSHIEDDTLTLLLGLLSKVLPNSNKSKTHLQPNIVSKPDEISEDNSDDHKEDDEEFEDSIDDEEEPHKSDPVDPPLIDEPHDEKDHDHPIDHNLLNKILPNLIQTVLEESRSLKPEESEQLKTETFDFVHKLLTKPDTKESSDNPEGHIKSQKETLELVNDLLDKAVPNEHESTTPQIHESETEIEQIKKETLSLVGDLLNKVDKITKTIDSKSPKAGNGSSSNISEGLHESTEIVDDSLSKTISNPDLSNPFDENDHDRNYLPVIDDIKEVSGESSPVDPQKEFIDDPPKETNDDLDESNDSSGRNQTDQLIPLIDIKSTINPKSIKANPLNRTSSVEIPNSTIKKLGKEFGSHEAIHTFRKSPFVFTKTGKLAAINRSFIRNTENPSGNNSRSGSLSESSGLSTPKKNLGITKRVSHNRSEIVAAVTQRLYSRRKQKEEDKMISSEGAGLRAFNAKIRLQDITQKALRASKRRSHVETQTEEPSTIRMKEKSTDVQDIAKVNLEVKDVEIEAIAKMETIGVSCQIQSSNSSIKLTGTSSTQTDEQKQNQTVSFTKYLQTPSPLRILPYSPPIYTSSVNISVQHNYPHSKDEQSDDSLDENCIQTVQFSTPDLISNHNSLEQVNVQGKPQVCVTTQTEKKSILHADISKENFMLNKCFATEKSEYCVAESSFVLPSVKQTLTDISIPVVRAPSVCCVDPLTECCKPLRLNCQKPDLAHPVMTFERCHNVKSTKPAVNQCPYQRSTTPRYEDQYSTDDESEEECCATTHKRVRFAPSKRKDILDVVTNFLDEASNLLFKLNTVANKVDQNKERQTRFVFPKIRNPRPKKECYVQTVSSKNDASSQTYQNNEETYVQTPDWNQIVVDSCQRIKECVDLTKQTLLKDDDKNKNGDESDNSDYMNMQTTSTDWKYCPSKPQDYSSLDTMRSTSDYGSMSRPKTQRKNHYSPKAYMKQLVEMRKKIVEDSRNDILANEYLRLPSPDMY